MAFPFYLAMTNAEYSTLEEKPPFCAWMACHFSPYGTGLSNFPPPLPENAMLILNDRTPIYGHDSGRILEQLLSCLDDGSITRILLDFQRPGCKQTAALTQFLAEKLPCPTGVSENYAKELNCPVFLSPLPPDYPPEQIFHQWEGREIWLDAAKEGIRIHIDAEGSTISSECSIPEDGIFSELTHGHYQISVSESGADFLLWRNREDIETLPLDSISLAVGLYQELQ